MAVYLTEQSRMSASSDASGFCNIYQHANNEHDYYTYTARNCIKRFKIRQTGSHGEWGAKAGTTCFADGALIILIIALTTLPTCFV